jgi:ABC-type lipoprotein export system ATPase subunit
VIPVLWFEGVWKAFVRGDDRVSVLEDVSLEVAAGEVAAVVGARGRGKTTLIRVASGTLSADRGSVMVRGRELTGVSDGGLTDVLQGDLKVAVRSGPWVRFNVNDYVEMSLAATREYKRKQRRERIAQTLELVGLEGCGTLKWDELSDWQRVLAEFAQAIVTHPKLLLVDDVVDGLALNHKQAAMTLMERFAKDLGCGVLMAVSDHAAALRSAKVWQLLNGRLELMHKDTDITYIHQRSEGGQAL